MTTKALISALVGCLSWLPYSSTADAAPFQQYKNGVCGASLICTIDFPVVQAGQRLEITNASCYLRVSGTHELYAMQLFVAEGTNTRSALTLQPKNVDVVSPFEAVYSASHPIFAFANAGQRLRAFVELKKGTFSQLACHISGRLQNLP
jgi:hypothetical protein